MEGDGMRIKVSELLTQTGMSDMQLAELLWPDANRKTQRVMIRKWQKYGTVSIRLDQLKVLVDLVLTSNVFNLVDFEEGAK